MIPHAKPRRADINLAATPAYEEQA